MQNAERRMQNCGVGKADGLVRGSQGLTERKRGAVSTAQDIGGFIPTISNQSGSPRDLSCGGSPAARDKKAPLAARGAVILSCKMTEGMCLFRRGATPSCNQGLQFMPAGQFMKADSFQFMRRKAQFIT